MAALSAEDSTAWPSLIVMLRGVETRAEELQTPRLVCMHIIIVRINYVYVERGGMGIPPLIRCNFATVIFSEVVFWQAHISISTNWASYIASDRFHFAHLFWHLESSSMHNGQNSMV